MKKYEEHREREIYIKRANRGRINVMFLNLVVVAVLEYLSSYQFPFPICCSFYRLAMRENYGKYWN